MHLPPALAPWASYLSLFPTVLSESLAPIVQRLERVLGPAESVMFSDSDEPEGYDGIARRGSYERLLISEWMLADEMPEEFLRRHSSGEHSFIEIARKTPTGQPRIVALFDTGPNQLGSPRIAHIAMLIVLARRADAMGRSIQWGILQKPELGFSSGVSQSDFETLLHHRSTKEVDDTDIENWFVQCKGELSNTYVIGGKRLVKYFAQSKVARLVIEDVLEPEVLALKTSFKAHGGKEINFTLPLPSPSNCTRLLRNPFVSMTKPAKTGKLSLPEESDGLFDHNGRSHFIIRAGANSIISYQLPRNPLCGQLKQRIYANSTHRPLYAAGVDVANRAAILIDCINETTLRIEMIGGRRQHEVITADLPFSLTAAEMSGSEPLKVITSSPRWKEQRRICFVAHGHLIEVKTDDRDPDRTAVVMAENTSTLWLKGEAILYLRQFESMCVSYCDDNKREDRHLPSGVTNVKVGFGGRWQDAQFGLIAYEARPGTWIAIDSEKQTTIDVPIDCTVTGVVGKWVERSPALIVLDSTRKRPYLLGTDWPLELPPSEEAPITGMTCNPSGVIAYLNSAGNLFLYWMDGDRWQKYLHIDKRFELLDKGGVKEL